MPFIDRLESLRKSKGISRKQLLIDCSLGKNQITYWEKNNTIPTKSVLKVLADYFGVSVEYLLDAESQAEPQPESLQETLLKYFQRCDAEGQLRVIQLAMNEYDRSVKEKTEAQAHSVG